MSTQIIILLLKVSSRINVERNAFVKWKRGGKIISIVKINKTMDKMSIQTTDKTDFSIVIAAGPRLEKKVILESLWVKGTFPQIHHSLLVPLQKQDSTLKKTLCIGESPFKEFNNYIIAVARNSVIHRTSTNQVIFITI